MSAKIDSNRAPIINGLSRKVKCLERRKEALEDRIRKSAGTEKSLDYDRAEAESLGAALDALRFHWRSIQRLDTPLVALGNLVETLDKGERAATAEALASAKDVLQDFGEL